ncbi:hypothetical protein [Caballeronia arationis]|uniref:hypothetical protein n=1 Tax=Caballeronia arationis TaxID=1777142 RepID=UPI00117FBF02|nr:hypothetical protein [Caballeronia arationis]
MEESGVILPLIEANYADGEPINKPTGTPRFVAPISTIRGGPTIGGVGWFELTHVSLFFLRAEMSFHFRAFYLID